jgi:hypothetical protein
MTWAPPWRLRFAQPFFYILIIAPQVCMCRRRSGHQAHKLSRTSMSASLYCGVDLCSMCRGGVFGSAGRPHTSMHRRRFFRLTDGAILYLFIFIYLSNAQQSCEPATALCCRDLEKGTTNEGAAAVKNMCVDARIIFVLNCFRTRFFQR